jgi:hypothetical protein
VAREVEHGERVLPAADEAGNEERPNESSFAARLPRSANSVMPR